MGWLLILMALGAFAVAFITTSMGVAVIALLASLLLLLAGVMKVLADRLGTRSRDEAMMIDPVELRRLREQAEARRNAEQAGGDAAPR